MTIPFTDKESDSFEAIEHEVLLYWFESAENKRIAEYELNRIMEGYDIPTRMEYIRKALRGEFIHD